MTDKIRVGDWVEDMGSGKIGKVSWVGPENPVVYVIGYGWQCFRSIDFLRKLSFSELPPEAWDNLKMDDDAITRDQTIKGAYIDPLTNHKITWYMNTVEEEIKDKLKGLGWKPPEDRWGMSFPEQDRRASERQQGGDHYKKYAIQPYEYCFKNSLNNLQSEAISYITRYKDKGGKQDLEKAIHTIELLIEAEGYDDE